jgi:hypothetical protein
MTGAAIVLKLAALRFCPLMGNRSTACMPGSTKSLPVLPCVAVIGLFVAIPALSARDVIISDGPLRTVLVLLAGALALIGAVADVLRCRMNAVLFAAGAGNR